MSQGGYQDVRCPVCGHKLLEAFGISAHLILRIKCTCRRVVEIREGFVAEIVRDDAKPRANQTI
jgi:phage FluMu protein Com